MTIGIEETTGYEREARRGISLLEEAEDTFARIVRDSFADDGRESHGAVMRSAFDLACDQIKRALDHALEGKRAIPAPQRRQTVLLPVGHENRPEAEPDGGVY